MKQIRGQVVIDTSSIKSSINKDAMNQLSKTLTHYLYEKYVEKIKNKLSTELVPKNFQGEAENFLFNQGLDYTREDVDTYCLAFYADYLRNLSSLVTYDEDTNKINVHRLLEELEKGGFYMPRIPILSEGILEIAKEAEDAMESVRR